MTKLGLNSFSVPNHRPVTPSITGQSNNKKNKTKAQRDKEPNNTVSDRSQDCATVCVGDSAPEDNVTNSDGGTSSSR